MKSRRKQTKIKQKQLSELKVSGLSGDAEEIKIKLRQTLNDLQVHQMELEMQNRELRAAQQQLEESRDRYRDFYDFAPVGYVTLNKTGVIKEINLTCASMIGVERARVIGMPFSPYVDKGDLIIFLDHLRRCKQGAEEVSTEFHLARKDGVLVPVVAFSVAFKDSQDETLYRTVISDLSKHKELEEQLHQMQKMEAIGQLAGGIAHDFNNILTIIMGNASLLQMGMRRDDPLLSNVNNIIASAKRGAAVVKSVLAIGRKQPFEMTTVNLNEVVIEALDILGRAVREDVKLVTILADEVLMVKADKGQLVQLLINLAANARDAMPEGGVLTIKTGVQKLDNEVMGGYKNPGTYAVITVADTGIGMDEMTQKKIFEPFFTTKDVGKGTGLGLSIVYGIIGRHKGYIDVTSEPEKGTTFKIFLPVSEARTKVKPSAIVHSTGGNEAILLAEDEDEIRYMTKIFLERSGYEVIDAVDGEDAVNKFKENQDKVRLLVLDAIMPKKNGREAWDDIKKIAPGIKALFLSGYTKGIIEKNGVVEEGLNFIAKPVSPEDLLQKVREVLDLDKED